MVLNEMKGVFSSPDTLLQSEVNRQLFPDSCYRYVSGGDPVHIPDLTYEQFLDSHRRFYHPSNSYIFLDGRVDLEQVLPVLDQEYLRTYAREDKIVEVHAKVGEEKLKAETTLDEGASYFGEVALVPYDSPIRNQELLFYNTLFDENAACHLAFGEAYAECIKGGEDMPKEELKAHGLNDSITHVDFMVGNADLRITGRTHDGREVAVFTDGNFAF